MEIAIIKRETTGSGMLQITYTLKHNVAIINYNFCNFLYACSIACWQNWNASFGFPKVFPLWYSWY